MGAWQRNRLYIKWHAATLAYRMYIYTSIADACQRNSLMQANLHRFYIYIYLYISIVCMYHAWAREAIYYSYAMCLLQGGPTIWACMPGWLVVLQCLLGHVAAMVGAVDAHRCHMGQWSTLSLKAIIVICTCQKHIYIYICCMICWFLYMFFLSHFMLAPSYLGPKYN